MYRQIQRLFCPLVMKINEAIDCIYARSRHYRSKLSIIAGKRLAKFKRTLAYSILSYLPARATFLRKRGAKWLCHHTMKIVSRSALFHLYNPISQCYRRSRSLKLDAAGAAEFGFSPLGALVARGLRRVLVLHLVALKGDLGSLGI